MDKEFFEDEMLRLLPDVDVDTLETLHRAAEHHSEICPTDVFYKIVVISIAKVVQSEGCNKALDLADQDWTKIESEELSEVGDIVEYYESATEIQSVGEWQYSFLVAQIMGYLEEQQEG